MRTNKTIQIGFFLAGSALLASAQAADWLQFGYDQRHSSSNPAETGISAANVASMARLYAVNLPQQTDSTPVFLSAVSTSSGTKDLLFLVTKDGHLLALDAATGAVVWSKQATPASGSNLTTGAPAIDPGRQFVYAYGLDGNVHKYQVGNGTEVTGNGWPQVSTLKPSVEKGAAGLAIASPPGGVNYLYSVIDGYIGDGGDYQGHITSINLSTGAQNVFNVNCSNLSVHFSTSGTNCSARQNGIWGRPGAVYDAGTNRIYIATGNGPFNANTGGFNWGDSVLALAPDGTGSGGGMPRDSYTPASYQGLQNTDADLGSTSPAILLAPSGSTYTHLAMQIAKDSCVRLINLDNMSGAGAPAHTGGELQQIALPNGGNNCTNGNDAGSNEVKPQPAVWVNPADSSTWTFIANGNGFTAYKLVVNAGVPSLSQVWTTTNGGTSPVVANNVLFYGSSGIVRALNPLTGDVLWSDSTINSLHWQSLIVVNGKLFLADSAHIYAYAPTVLNDLIFANGFDG